MLLTPADKAPVEATRLRQRALWRARMMRPPLLVFFITWGLGSLGDALRHKTAAGGTT
jgi:hypothetical protein